MNISERGSRLKRSLDSCFGRPLLFGLALIRRRRKQPVDVESIGLMMLAAIGDTILASAIFPDLRRTYPNATITAFVSKANRSVLELLDDFDFVVEVPVSDPPVAVKVIRQSQVQIMIDIGQWTRMSAILCALSNAHFTVGFKSPGQHRHVAYDAFAVHSQGCHEVDNFRALAACLGIQSKSNPRLRASLAAIPSDSISRPYVVLHPWASGYRSNMREWNLENWVGLAEFIIGWGYSVVITGGPADIDRANALAADIGNPSYVDVTAGRANLRQTAIKLVNASAVIAVNTGTMHLAALLNRPLIALHGPTNSKRWGPLGNKSIVIGPGPEQGGAYLNLGFEYPRNPPDCMAKISLTEVISCLSQILKTPQSLGQDTGGNASLTVN